jgi:signal peptidase I
LESIAKSASQAAKADARWRSLAAATSNVQNTVAYAAAGHRSLTLVSRLNRDEQAIAKACAVADPQDGWGSTIYVPSGSMAPTVRAGDWVAYKPFDLQSQVERGEIIVFNAPSSWTLGDGPERFIKRVIGVGGDHVVCCDPGGHITDNGTVLREPYLPGGKASDVSFDVQVPSGFVWVMGDNRNESLDSRAYISDGQHGCIPVKNVTGIVTRITKPPSHAGPVTTPTYHGL